MSVNLNVNTLQASLQAVTRGIQFNEFEAEVILLGAGGRGGVYPSEDFSRASCGGGAGSFLSASFLIPATSSLNIHVGLGGSGSLSGSYPNNVYRISRAEDTKISLTNDGVLDLFIARGGGAGESSPDGFGTGDGEFPLSQINYEPNTIEGFGIYDGGSGGGVFATASNQQPRTPRSKSIPVVIREGEVLASLFTGSIGGAGDVGSEGFRFREPAGGGGALQSGSKSRFMSQYPEGAGAGFNLDNTFLKDIRVYDVSQGAGFGLQSDSEPSYIAPPNRGWGGGISGSSGLVAIKYFGEQKIFGDAGEVITLEDYTIHIFTASADITTTGKTYSGSDVDIAVPEIPVEAIILGGGGGYGFIYDQNDERAIYGGGGGAGAAVSGSFVLGRNTTFNINIGKGGFVSSSGEESYMYGFIGSENLDTYSTASSEITMSAHGGDSGSAARTNRGDGGNSGQGFYIIGDNIEYYPSYSGAPTTTGPVPGNPNATYTSPGGGASNTSDGLTGSLAGGGDSVLGLRTTQVENSAIPYLNVTADLSSNHGAAAYNGNITWGPNTWGSGAPAREGDFSASPGLLLMRYPQFYDKYDVQVTGNVTSSLRGGSRIHQFNIGEGTIRVNYNPTGST